MHSAHNTVGDGDGDNDEMKMAVSAAEEVLRDLRQAADNMRQELEAEEQKEEEENIDEVREDVQPKPLVKIL